jgi:hypothetical protein
MIKQIIETLQLDSFYGAGECTEIAKGKYELVTDFNGLKRKAKRLWLKK